MLDLANEVAKLQGRLFLSTFRQKSHSSLVLNTEHNGVVQELTGRVNSSSERVQTCMKIISAGKSHAYFWMIFVVYFSN